MAMTTHLSQSLQPVLIVDDDRDLASQFARILARAGLASDIVYSGEAAIEALETNHERSAVLLDLMMPGIGGSETLKRIQNIDPLLPVIVVSGQEKVSVAVEALRLGAYDYLVKPVDTETLTSVAKHAAAHRRVSAQLSRLRQEVRKAHLFDRLIGRSESMLNIFRLIEKTLDNDIAVLILGESGTGKELIARAVHFNGIRGSEPFVVVNCAAIPRELVESELFGHEKGSFTGATEQKIGKFELAHGGSLFLDEIGELETGVQAKLLRAIQEGEIDRVGGVRPIPIDVRLICATQRDLEKELKEGRFREDLYYRINAFPVVIPPLRERREDIELLSIHFLDKQRHHLGRKNVNGITRAALNAFNRFDWPGNVRQLENVIGRAVVLAEEDFVCVADLPESIRSLAPEENREQVVTDESQIPPEVESLLPLSAATSDSEMLSPFRTPEDVPTFNEIKAWAIRQAYNACNGNISLTAKKLGLGRATLYRLMKKYEIVAFGVNGDFEDDTGNGDNDD
ncbi:MAG: sigma-54 dependent transcriptional regulator [bacterium]